MKIAWDQPHEGNLFEFLYKRRAIDRQPAGPKTAPATALNRMPEKVV
jgi:hypothetical protein